MPLNGKHKPSAEPRPYTAYNVFFQLEREYILQKTLQVFPTLELSETFHLNSEMYKGPPLPSRYSELILHREWHVSGKGRRNKRSHRASHGKIGFKELSKQIAKSWASADSETKQFCKDCSGYCKLQYKSNISNKEPCRKITMTCQGTKASESSDMLIDAVISNPELSMFADDRATATRRAPPVAQQTTWTSTVSQVFDTSEPINISTEEVDMLDDYDTSTTLEREFHSMQETPEALNSIIIDTLFEGLPLSVNDEALVDMEDNKIIDLWHSIHHWGITPAF
ncbi:hypothetical protein HJC23_007853 [Cyclotella cryptica]|uniref:HMG box domain-containing protein n=1 Tax=Cyclotella cryptica TaxID=29204 RepID=A0ABD3R056_9STRA|eukprot:CCRYP_000188-RA/>CCRYP_000188-RA protein AED:0.04 eAED:0.00 QI:0/0/0/1/1/1/2/0/281